MGFNGALDYCEEDDVDDAKEAREAARRELFEHKTEVPVWTQRDGTKIAVKDMTTSHVRNSLKMLIRNGFSSARDYYVCLYGPQPRGEMACDALDRALDDAKPNQFVDIFRADLKRRGEPANRIP